MTVTFTPAGGSAQSLAGSEASGADGVLGLNMRGESLVQREAMIRGNMAVYHRKNRRVTGSFTVRKQHSTHATAMAYIASHTAALEGVGAILFTYTGGSLTLTNAVVVAEGRSLGATTEWQYSYEGTN